MKRTFDDELNEIRRRAGLKEQTLVESMNFTAYKKDEKGRWVFGFPDKWTEPEIYKIPYEEIDWGAYVNDEGYAEKVSGPNPDYRPDLTINIGHGNDADVMRFLRDEIGMDIEAGPDGFLYPTKRFVWQIKAWQQKEREEYTPEILPYDTHDPDSVPNDHRVFSPLGGQLVQQGSWERKREGNVVDLKPTPKHARIIGTGRKAGYVEEKVEQMLELAEKALEMGISHVGMG